MNTVKMVYWENGGAWIGYLQDYPDYWTQGESLDDLREHLKDLHQDITDGYVRPPAETDLHRFPVAPPFTPR